jgi:hypothetical protein
MDRREKLKSLEVEYHPSKNDVPFARLTPNSNRIVWWRCKYDTNNEWQAAVADRVRSKRDGCPYCYGRRATKKTMLAATHPHVAAQYHPTKNAIPLSEISYGSAKMCWWVCDFDHEFEAQPNNRTNRDSGCPYCYGLLVSDWNSLKIKAPWLEAEFSSENTVSFESLSYGAPYKAWWDCRKNPTHKWQALISDRVRGSGCPYCSHRHSKGEVAILAAVKEKYPDTAGSKRGLLQNIRLELDIFVPSLRKAVEYDGVYWHSRLGMAERDVAKNEHCRQAGIGLLRVSDNDYKADRAGTISRVLGWLSEP